MQRLTLTRRLALTLTALELALASCSEDDNAPPPDPYDTYMENAPSGEPLLSREDAQTRALLGCGTTWAPGTVDAVLQDAYEESVCKP